MTNLDGIIESKAVGQGEKKAQSASRVAKLIRDQIGDGALLPGTKLAEESLSDVLGVSRNTLREAFATLRSEGLVSRMPNRGVFVKEPSVEDVREMYRARRIIEPGSLLWGTGATSGLREIVERGLRGVESHDVEAMASANQDFHRAIVARSGSVRLQTTMDRILVEMRLVFHGMASNQSFHEPYVGHNAEIVTLLEKGDNAVAADGLMHYLTKAETQLVAEMTKMS